MRDQTSVCNVHLLIGYNCPGYFYKCRLDSQVPQVSTRYVLTVSPVSIHQRPAELPGIFQEIAEWSSFERKMHHSKWERVFGWFMRKWVPVSYDSRQSWYLPHCSFPWRSTFAKHHCKYVIWRRECAFRLLLVIVSNPTAGYSSLKNGTQKYFFWVEPDYLRSLVEQTSLHYLGTWELKVSDTTTNYHTPFCNYNHANSSRLTNVGLGDDLTAIPPDRLHNRSTPDSFFCRRSLITRNRSHRCYIYLLYLEVGATKNCKIHSWWNITLSRSPGYTVGILISWFQMKTKERNLQFCFTRQTHVVQAGFLVTQVTFSSELPGQKKKGQNQPRWFIWISSGKKNGAICRNAGSKLILLPSDPHADVQDERSVDRYSHQVSKLPTITSPSGANSIHRLLQDFTRYCYVR